MTWPADGIPNFQLNIVEMCSVYALFCRFQCVPLQCSLHLVHPSLSNISLNISSVWSKLSSPLIYKSALQHPYLPILPNHTQSLFCHRFQAPLKTDDPWEMLGDVLGDLHPNKTALQVVYHRCFNLGSWLGFGDCRLVIARWFSWVPWALNAVDGWMDVFRRFVWKAKIWWIFGEEYIVWVGEGNISSGSIYVEHDVYQVCRGYVRCIL